MHTINLPYKQGYVTPVPASVVVNTYEFREAEDPSVIYDCFVPYTLGKPLHNMAISDSSPRLLPLEETVFFPSYRIHIV